MLVPIAGILDVLDNYAFVRTTGYLPGTSDVYVSLGQVKKYNLRKGDAVVGAIKQPREGEQSSRQKYNALVKVDAVNGLSVEDAAERVEFGKLTPLYPQERLRLETAPGEAHPADHRPRRPDRQGPARPDRRAAQGGQDDRAAADRQRDRHEQP